LLIGSSSSLYQLSLKQIRVRMFKILFYEFKSHSKKYKFKNIILKKKLAILGGSFEPPELKVALQIEAILSE